MDAGPSGCRVVARPSLRHAAGWKRAGGREKTMTGGSEDARETRKDEARDWFKVHAQVLCLFTGLEQTHPGSSAWSKPQGPTAVGVGWGGVGCAGLSRGSGGVCGGGLGGWVRLCFPSDSGDCRKMIPLDK